MVKAYLPREGTRQELDDLHADLKSNARVAEWLNAKSRGQPISANQVRRMRAGQAVRLSQGQKRRLQRNTSTSNPSRRREQVSRTSDRKESALRNIRNKKARLEAERDRLLIIGRVTDARAIDDEIARLDDFRDDIQLAARNVETYDDYRNIADKATP